VVKCLYREWNCLQYGNIATLHVCTGTGTVCSTVTLQRYMFVQGMELSEVRKHCNVTCLYRDWNCLQYGNIAMLHVCTGTGTVCSTVKLQLYMFVQGMELSAVRKHCNGMYLYRDWNCLQYGNIATLHVCTGNGTVCSTVTLQRYIYIQGMELSAVR